MVPGGKEDGGGGEDGGEVEYENECEKELDGDRVVGVEHDEEEKKGAVPATLIGASVSTLPSMLAIEGPMVVVVATVTTLPGVWPPLP